MAEDRTPGVPVEEQKPEPPAPEQPPQSRDASCGEKEEVVYLNLDQLYPFGVRDDVEMQGLVSSVKAGGVHQPALVRPREGGGYEIIAGHHRQWASELAGLQQQYETIKHQGAWSDGADVGKLSLNKLGERNGMSGKTVQRYRPCAGAGQGREEKGNREVRGSGHHVQSSSVSNSRFIHAPFPILGKGGGGKG